MDLSRAARWTAFAATALVVVATLVHGWSIAVDDPYRPPTVGVFAVERGEDYAAWTQVFSPRSHASVLYTTNGTPDRIILVRVGDIDAVLRGDDVTPIEEFGPPQGIGPFSRGRLDFAVPMPQCPPPTGGCIDETIPALVWLKGDGWRGASAADALHYRILHDNWEGPVTDTERHDGPVRPDVSHTREEIVANAPRWLGLAATAGAIGILAALAYAVVELRRPNPAALVPPAPRAESTETMLVLARLTTLYVDSVRRSFLVSLAAIVGITAAVMFFGLPPMLERVSEQFRHLWEAMELHVALFVLAPLYVMTIALLFWLVAYWRVRRELQEWRRRSKGFDDETARILGA